MAGNRLVGIGIAVAALLAVVGGVGFLRAADNSSGSTTVSAAALATGSQPGSLSSSSPAQQEQEKPWLGVYFVRSSDGVTIAYVIADSPADKADLKRGDVIKAVNGTAVETPQEFRDQLKDKQVGDTVTLNIDRDGQTLDVSVTLEAQPEPLSPAIPLLPELEGIPADGLFSHVQGGQFNFTDEQGNPLTVTIDVGTVASVNSGAGTLTLNLNAGGSKTYTVDDEDIGGDKLSDLEQGDKVAVMRVGDDVRAVVRGVGPLLPGLGRGPGHGFGFEGGPRGRFGEWGGEYGGPMMPQQAPEEAPVPGSGTGL
jgi:membrane-associated protease RseP (regulator of RpoE activity)